MPDTPQRHSRHIVILTWVLRVLVGGTFIVSGLAKSVDIWGFVYKIEQYLNVWGLDEPRSVVVVVATALSAFEFVMGVMVACGSYKRAGVWLLSLAMVVMLALSVYVAVADPVPDCGCFGDLWVISNTATCVKNILLMAALVFLIRYNRSAGGLYIPYLQWITVVACAVYVLVVASFGYQVQPLLDFRQYKIGTPLAVDDDSDEETTFAFIYEKQGVRREFTADNLPDSTWSFVDRRAVGGGAEAAPQFMIYDGDDEVTSDVISPSGEEILLLIPEMKSADISMTYIVNEMYRYVTSRSGEMIGIVASANERELDYWSDISMAAYPLYTAEDTSIKELARGTVSVVYLVDGVIRWKRTMLSIPNEIFSKHPRDAFERLDFNGPRRFAAYTFYLVAVMLVLLMFNQILLFLKRIFHLKNKEKG